MRRLLSKLLIAAVLIPSAVWSEDWTGGTGGDEKGPALFPEDDPEQLRATRRKHEQAGERRRREEAEVKARNERRTDAIRAQLWSEQQRRHSDRARPIPRPRNSDSRF